jgi:hypothetical protein
MPSSGKREGEQEDKGEAKKKPKASPADVTAAAALLAASGAQKERRGESTWGILRECVVRVNMLRCTSSARHFPSSPRSPPPPLPLPLPFLLNLW